MPVGRMIRLNNTTASQARSRRWPDLTAVESALCADFGPEARRTANQDSTHSPPTLGGEAGFRLQSHAGVAIRGIAWLALMGLIGGRFPASRTARLPIARALRELYPGVLATDQHRLNTDLLSPSGLTYL